MALCFIAVFDFVIVVVVVVNVVVLVIGVIFVGSNAVAVNMRIHGEGKAPDDNALVDSNNLQVGGEIPHHPPPPTPMTMTTARCQVPSPPTETMR